MDNVDEKQQNLMDLSKEVSKEFSSCSMLIIKLFFPN